MGSAFIVFQIDDTKTREDDGYDISYEIDIRLFSVILEEMSSLYEDSSWKEELEVAYSIKYLYVGLDCKVGGYSCGMSNAFISAIYKIMGKSLPEYYNEKESEIYYSELKKLESKYKEVIKK